MKLFNRLGKWSVVMCLLSLLSSNVFALDEVDFEITADYNGKYVWRGQNLDDDPAFQPGFSLTYEGLTFGVWGNLETTKINNNSGEFTEVDQYVDYSGDIDGLGYSIGLIYYDFPGTTLPRTAEAYWGFSFDYPLSPSITVYHDIDEADGIYASLGIGHSIELDSESSAVLELGASLGWGDDSYNEYYWVDSVTSLPLKDSGFNDLALSASLPFEVGGWSVTPSVNYVKLIDGDIKDTNAYGKDDNIFYVGIGFAKGF